MAVRDIRIAGDPVLHQPTRTVTAFDDSLRALINDMFDTMAAAKGVGLAANQIGVDLRLFVYDCPIDDEGKQLAKGVVVNPTLEMSERPLTMPDEDSNEGCLSVPGYWLPTGRADWAKVTGFDGHGEPVTVEGTGFLARCLQHETDHLDGLLYLDRLVGRYKKEAKKILKSNSWGVPGLSWDPATSADPFAEADQPE